MTYFADMTPYTYFHPEEDPPGTVNVGWLERWQPFREGETSEEFRAKLEQLSRHRVKRTRGFQKCSLCRGGDKPGGSAEIRVRGEQHIFAAPELLYHYVVAHGYLPPEEFIAAVLAWEEDGDPSRQCDPEVP